MALCDLEPVQASEHEGKEFGGLWSEHMVATGASSECATHHSNNKRVPRATCLRVRPRPRCRRGEGAPKDDNWAQARLRVSTSRACSPSTERRARRLRARSELDPSRPGGISKRAILNCSSTQLISSSARVSVQRV